MEKMLEPSKFYHLYNHANGNENLFRTDENYRFFLDKVLLYISPIADIYAFCLMPNHFHFLLKTKPKEVFLTFPKFETLEKFSTKEEHYQLGKFISRQLGNLFSSYTQSFNKMYDRKGSLFIKNCKHKELKNEKYFNNIVHYIHANPVLHGFVKNIEDWKWSSYQSIISLKKSHLQRETVITWFGDAKQYLTFHQKEIDRRLIAEFES